MFPQFIVMKDSGLVVSPHITYEKLHPLGIGAQAAVRPLLPLIDRFPRQLGRYSRTCFVCAFVLNTTYLLHAKTPLCAAITCALLRKDAVGMQFANPLFARVRSLPLPA